MLQRNPGYNPEKYDPSIQGLLARAKDDWGDVKENRMSMVRYGIDPLDLALYGINTTEGELIVVLGEEKGRKTTFVQNVVENFMEADTPTIKPFTVIDALESGMGPLRYRDTMIAQMATRYLLKKGHSPSDFCNLCNGECMLLDLSPEFFRYRSRTREQEEAIDYALTRMSSWPMHIYGAGLEEGNTRSLQHSVSADDSRWKYLIEEIGAEIFVVDHLQQYSFGREDTTDYEKQIRSISVMGDIVAQHKVVIFLVSQISLTSLREARQGNGKITASGGRKSQQEANVVLSTKYSPGSGFVRVKIEESRKSGSFHVFQPLEDASGAFYGKARTDE